jgi:hypothetical protein
MGKNGGKRHFKDVKNPGYVAKPEEKSTLNPLIKDLYKLTSNPEKPADLEEVFELGNMIEIKQSTFVAPSHNLDRVKAANQLIEHIKK